MSLDTLLNQKYAELCKELGHVTMQLQKLGQRKTELEQQINTLNDSAPVLRQLEAAQAKSKPTNNSEVAKNE